MIRLTRINHTSFYLNSDLIEFVEATPDTVISLVHGGKVMTLESAEEVVERIVEFRKRILPAPASIRITGPPPQA
ncbi:MAG: flagellar FlbD family protein [Acidobacteria bacterium]|nr:flagellar FlbD family protein [Acidobacteriota bacterium]